MLVKKVVRICEYSKVRKARRVCEGLKNEVYGFSKFDYTIC